MAGCSRCAQRGQAITRGAAAAVRGDIRTAASSAAFVGRTLAQDARSGALRQAASAKLAQLQATVIRRR